MHSHPGCLGGQVHPVAAVRPPVGQVGGERREDRLLWMAVALVLLVVALASVLIAFRGV